LSHQSNPTLFCLKASTAMKASAWRCVYHCNFSRRLDPDFVSRLVREVMDLYLVSRAVAEIFDPRR
jgi:hypothetical protein